MPSAIPSLPAGFRWGAATAAYQIEGAVTADGRTPSIWDTFSHTPGAVDNGDTGDEACDSYNRWPEDLALLRELGVDSYRFSVAWPRILPDRSGAVNPAGLGYYDRLVDDLLGAGIRPLLTVYHWDLPQYLQDAGGWPARDTAYRMAEYAAVLAGALGDRVTDWATVNEPLCIAWIGHLDGKMAPGLKDIELAVPASHHVLLAHGLAMQAIRAEAAAPPSVGIVLNLTPSEPATNSREDAEGAVRADGHSNRWFLDPIFGRGFPRDMCELYGVQPPVRDGDLDIISAPMDYLGINYYFRAIVEAASDSLGGYRQLPVAGAATTAMGWEIRPQGLHDILLRVHTDYQPASIFVTESGCAVEDTVAADGTIDDPERISYLESHLVACQDAISKGVPVHGYYAWSLLDNFEWSFGYDKRFGLAYVDYRTQQRTIKSSGRRYAEIIAAHRTANGGHAVAAPAGPATAAAAAVQ
jgi:beta-glucosidase